MLATKEKKSTPAIEHPSGDARFKLVDRALKRLHFQQDALIEVLHVAQESFGYLDEGLLIYVARQLKLPPSWVFGVATFYHFFSLEPKGEHQCIVCMGTACYVKGAGDIVACLEKEYNLKAGETTADGKFSLTEARCLGSCGLAPILILDNQTLGKETPASAAARVREALQGQAGKNGRGARPKVAADEEEFAEGETL
ncbi:MAG: bidirectional hydrogenase complex protein HoxE [Anaerolineae bacterium]|nr:bidirectional hydrogenase complex protein HoxE [Anaerolineae bacterium]